MNICIAQNLIQYLDELSERWLLAFKKTNQNTQEVKNERFFFYID